jgi:ABC-type protease/lipase transport system fused ATPase/permease subunit
MMRISLKNAFLAVAPFITANDYQPHWEKIIKLLQTIRSFKTRNSNRSHFALCYFVIFFHIACIYFYCKIFLGTKIKIVVVVVVVVVVWAKPFADYSIKEPIPRQLLKRLIMRLLWCKGDINYHTKLKVRRTKADNPCSVLYWDA